MPTFFYKSRFILVLSFALALLLSGSCKKIGAALGSRSDLEALFEENLLNRNFIVNKATDTAINLTSQFTGYNFVLTKTTSFYDGVITATRSGETYSGTWTSNDDYSKLVISFNPSSPPEFMFIMRAWKFTKKAVPVMELAPWGTIDPKVLHMKRL